MRNMLLVGVGGFVGAVSRYKLSGLVIHISANHKFPFATLTVNLLGSLIIGVLAGFAQKHHLFTFELRLLLITGLLGGFTTFSSFSLESIYLLKRGSAFIAVLYVVLSILVGIFLAGAGYLSTLKILQ